MFKSRFFSPTELVFIIYMIITAGLIVVYSSTLPNAFRLLLVRSAFVLMILLLSWLEIKGKYSRIIDLIRYAFPLLIISYFYTETDLLNNLIIKSDLDPWFSKLEQNLFGFQPAYEFALYFPSNIVAELMYFGYFSYYIMLILVPLFLYFKRGDEIANKTMFIIIFSFLMFYLAFIVFPVAGPQFYYSTWPELPQGILFGPLIRIIQANGEAPTAAFPSSHVSICLMLIFICFRHALVLVKLIIPSALLLILSTVYIRAHYLVDVLAAFMVTPPLYLLSESVYYSISKRFNFFKV